MSTSRCARALASVLVLSGCGPREDQEQIAQNQAALVSISSHSGAYSSVGWGTPTALGGDAVILDNQVVWRRGASGDWFESDPLPGPESWPTNILNNMAVRGRLKAGLPGQVELWEHSTSGWKLTTTLSSPDPSPDDRFGDRIYLEPGRIVVGAPGSDAAFPNAGAIYVFDLVGSEWRSSRLLRPGAQQDDGFNAVGADGNQVVGQVANKIFAFESGPCGWRDLPTFVLDPGVDDAGVDAGAEPPRLDFLSFTAGIILVMRKTQRPNPFPTPNLPSGISNAWITRLELRTHRLEPGGWVEEGVAASVENSCGRWLGGALAPGAMVVGYGYYSCDYDVGSGFASLRSRTETGYTWAADLPTEYHEGAAQVVAISDTVAAFTTPARHTVHLTNFTVNPAPNPGDAGATECPDASDSAPDVGTEAGGDSGATGSTDASDSATDAGTADAANSEDAAVADAPSGKDATVADARYVGDSARPEAGGGRPNATQPGAKGDDSGCAVSAGLAKLPRGFEWSWAALVLVLARRVRRSHNVRRRV
jgi:MYXO-CTERM domain-containing protein